MVIASLDNVGLSVAAVEDINDDGLMILFLEHLMLIQVAELVRDKHV
ncbi:hypothetical protein MHYMCMPSP_00173 [Hyalomma marginatum]|uniref:Uncharacterized protein n=1 Tax=Hyalomma marginatum TaxID=34627 RepID=A0A8S4C2R0_9ACAR|nr:hypothetical protein MHYMCMPSP_00173 [Hyalomma marginatum]CAG7593637.1 hypothetical protein MHYMCMPASI_00701 [Hyalomma marginatum]